MKNKPLPAHRVSELSRDGRATVRLSRRATGNTIIGGCSALVLATRMDRMGCKINAVSIVSHVYAGSTGRTCEETGGWECPECGSAHVDECDAAGCCFVSDEN